MSESGNRSAGSMTDLGGIFYPVGYMVAAFPGLDHAEQARTSLLGGGYEDADVKLYRCDEVDEAARKNLAENTSWLALLGKSDEAVRRHLASARQGAAFLLIYAPSDTESARAMNVIRRGAFEFVHRYHRLAIEDVT